MTRGTQPADNMSTNFSARLIAITACALLAFGARAEDMVTIPKSRLQELERKEAELEKLKGEVKATRAENTKLKQETEAVLAKAATGEPVIQHASPPMASLPPLKPGEAVDAMDLLNHYKADPAAAGQRYGKRELTVKGTIVAFDKPMFLRPYFILLRTTDRQTPVVCKFDPAAEYTGVFTVKNGSELVGESSNRRRVTLAKVGDVVTVHGRCKGLDSSGVQLTGCELK
jgi:hypothetical protein